MSVEVCLYDMIVSSSAVYPTIIFCLSFTGNGQKEYPNARGANASKLLEAMFNLRSKEKCKTKQL